MQHVSIKTATFSTNSFKKPTLKQKTQGLEKHGLDAVIPAPNYRDRDPRYQGREKVGVIWKLYAIMHNISKIVLYSPKFGNPACI